MLDDGLLLFLPITVNLKIFDRQVGGGILKLSYFLNSPGFLCQPQFGFELGRTGLSMVLGVWGLGLDNKSTALT